MMHGMFAGLTKTASRLRWTKLGVKRYPIAMICNWLKGHSFPVEFSYLPKDAPEEAPTFEDWKDSHYWVHERGDFNIVNLWVSWLKMDPIDSKATCNDSLIWLHCARNLSRFQMLKKVISKKIEFWRYDDGNPIPDGLIIEGVKAISLKVDEGQLGGGDLWKRDAFVYDGEPEPLPYRIAEFRAKIGNVKARVFM